MKRIGHIAYYLLVIILFAACGSGKLESVTESTGEDATSPESLRALIPNLVTDTDWDLSGELRWGFIFTDPRKQPLVKLSEELAKQGYTEVELSQRIAAKAEWRLHAEKIERMKSTDALVAEGEKMHQLATRSHVLNFSEVNVSPVNDSKVENQYQQGWWTYFSEFDGEPSATSLNLALCEGAPYLDFPSLVITGIDYPTDDEVPVERRFKEVHELRADRITKLKLFAYVIEAGAQISGGQETHYIYVNDTTGLQELLREYYTQNYPGHKYRIEIKGNIGWDVYLRELFPNSAIIGEYEEELKDLGLWQWVEDAH